MLKEIETRQSIRKYKDVPVSEDQLDAVLRAAMNAPSARNEQCWRFMIVQNRKVLDDIASLSSYMKMMESAPCCILVLADKTIVPYPEYMYYDCSAAIENILIEANHQGLGTCWCAIAPNEDRIATFCDYFELPEDLVPISAVALGVSDEEKSQIDRYDPDKILKTIK